MRHYLLFGVLYSAFIIKSATAQQAVKMADQPGHSFTENFDDIENWADDFSSGDGAEYWQGLPVNTTGTIPDGITVTDNTQTFADYYLSTGVHPNPSTVSETYMFLLANGSDDNTTAVAMDFSVDFSNTVAGMLAFDAGTIDEGRSSSNKVATLQVFYSVDGGAYTRLTGARYEAINHSTSNASTHIQVPLLPEMNNALVVFRFYCYNGVGGTDGNRPAIFYDNLNVTATTPLPVTLENFTATRKNNNVQINWQTDSEFNSKSFLLQRSLDGANFTTIATKAAAGNSRQKRYYHYIDRPAMQGPFFYRLQMLDLDGKFTFSKTIKIDYQAVAHISLSPVPSGNKLRVQLPQAAKKRYQALIINASGKVVAKKLIHRGAGFININIRRLSPGEYFLKLPLLGSAIPFIKK